MQKEYYNPVNKYQANNSFILIISLIKAIKIYLNCTIEYNGYTVQSHKKLRTS